MEQLVLGARKGRGGKRTGAGRKPTRPGRRVEHRARPAHPAREPVHVTVRVRQDVGCLREHALANAIGCSLRKLQKRAETFRVVEFSIQTDHLHLIVEAQDEKALSNGMRAVNIRLAKTVNRTLGRSGPVVQDRYHQHKLATPTEVRNALVYVLFNYKKHSALAGEIFALIDSRSSGPWFPGFADREPSSTSPPVSRARTPLLSFVWKQLGLIRRYEGPRAARI
jgi:putative transposase